MENPQVQDSAEEPQEIPPTRWEIELEFVQSISNLNYLNYLAQNKYLEDPRFLSYLRYLYNYWSLPENIKYIIYPNCLHILKLIINSKTFNQEILKREVAAVIMNDMVENWKKTKSVETITAKSRAGTVGGSTVGTATAATGMDAVNDNDGGNAEMHIPISTDESAPSEFQARPHFEEQQLPQQQSQPQGQPTQLQQSPQDGEQQASQQ